MSEQGRAMGNGHGWTLERWLLVLTFVGTSLIGVFGLGVQWNETTHVKAEQAAQAKQAAEFAASVERTYLRSDVYAADRQRLSDSIDRLTRVLEGKEGRRPIGPTFSDGTGQFGGH